MRRFVLGVDFAEPEEIRLGMVDEDNLIKHYETVPGSVLNNPQSTPLASLVHLLNDYLTRCEIRPLALSVGFPSMLDRSRRRVQSTPNLPWLSNIDLVSVLERDLHISPVYINRDAVMLYYQDRFVFQLPVDSIIVGCYIGSGMGNVISIKGHILYGHNGAASELGHVPVYGLQKQCVCGNQGCIENLVSWARLAEIAKKHYGDQPFKNIFKEHMDDPEVLEFIEAIAVAISIEINLLDPEFVILGGRIVQLPGFPKKEFEKRLLAHARKPFPALNLKVLYASIKPENGVKGAAMYGFECLKRDGRR